MAQQRKRNCTKMFVVFIWIIPTQKKEDVFIYEQTIYAEGLKQLLFSLFSQKTLYFLFSWVFLKKIKQNV